MDRRESMTFSGPATYYMQRGMPGSGSDLQGSPRNSQSLNAAGLSFQTNLVGSSVGSTLPVEPPVVSPHGINVGAPGSSLPSGEPVKRKRGRPRKYGQDGAMSLALTPSPSTPSGTTPSTQKRGRGRPPGTGSKQQLASFGEWISGSAGMGFTPHVITIAIGEDITTKIMSFSQQGPRAVCILSANGAVSTVTLRQASTSGGSVTYEGRFEILCLSGSYLVNDNGGGGGGGGDGGRSGGLSVSLATPDGRVIGGGVGGGLIAASLVQVIVGSFIWGRPKAKNKAKEEGGSAAHQMADYSGASTGGGQADQSLNLTSSMNVRPVSGTVDVHNTHVDIDLMRG